MTARSTHSLELGQLISTASDGVIVSLVLHSV